MVYCTINADLIGNNTRKAEDILSPDCRWKIKKKPSTPLIQKEYSNDGLSGCTCIQLKGSPSSLYIYFFYLLCARFFPAAVRGLSISWA